MANYNISNMGIPPLNPSKHPKLSKREIEQLLGIEYLDEDSRSIIEFILDKKRVECKPEGVKRLEEILREDKLKDEDVKILKGFKRMFLEEYNSYTTEKVWKEMVNKQTASVRDPYSTGLNLIPSEVDMQYIEDESGNTIRVTNEYLKSKSRKVQHSQIERLEELIKNGEIKIPTPPKSRKLGNTVGVLNLFENTWKLVKSLVTKSVSKEQQMLNEVEKDLIDIRGMIKDKPENKSGEKLFKEKPLWKRIRL